MVGIVILNYNGAQTTIDCIESVVKFNTCPSKYVIVDNASKDDSVAVLTSYLSSTYKDEFSVAELGEPLNRFNLVVEEKNGGYAQGNNAGLKYLAMDDEVDHVMILNSDVLFTSDIIPGLVEKLGSIDDAGIVSPLLYAKDGKTIDYNCARLNPSNYAIINIFLLQYHDVCGSITKARRACKILMNHPEKLNEEVVPIGIPSGSCMLVRKDVFQEIGWFDPNTFLYYEENILYKKLLKIGKKNYTCPKFSCIHLGAQSTSKNPVPFLKVKEAGSAIYYLKNYGNMRIDEKIVAFVAFKLFFSRMRLAALVRQIKNK